MPRVRVRLPVDVEVSPETARATRAALELATAVVESDLLGAAKDLGRALRDAWRARRPRPAR